MLWFIMGGICYGSLALGVAYVLYMLGRGDY